MILAEIHSSEVVERNMKKATLLWAVAIIVTLLFAFYQRLTGPTYPVFGKITLSGKEIAYRLERSHGGAGNCTVEIKTDDGNVAGTLEWKRFKTDDNWMKVPMSYRDGILSAELLHQPLAGKLEYRITLQSSAQTVLIPEDKPVVIRFRGDVPPIILIPHIIVMFGAMLLSTRTGLECFRKEPHLTKLTFWTLGLLLAGGFVLGPLTQLYAFGTLWSGFPFGHDLTDSKTLIALIGWIIALIAIYRSARPQPWVLFAAILMLLVYLIPHSVLGSELSYGKLEKQKSDRVQEGGQD